MRTLLLACSFLVVAIVASDAHAEERFDFTDEEHRLVVATGPELVAQPKLVPTSCCRKKRRDWSFSIAPYGWLASARGTAVADGVEEDFEIPVADSIEQTNFGYQVILGVRWRRWFAFVDITRAILRDETGGPIIGVDLKIRQWIVEYAIGYQVLGRPHSDPKAACCPSLDVFAGVRYNSTEIDITVNTPIGSATGASRDDWFDPFIGFRLQTPIVGRLGLSLRGDYGGFGIGDASQSAWQAWALLTWRLSPQWHLAAGYRISYYDRIEGSGTNRNGADLYQYGPMFGVSLRF